MDSLSIRRVSNATLALSLFFTILFIFLLSFFLYAVYMDEGSLFGVFVLLYSFLFFLPLLCIEILILVGYFTKITFTKSQITIAYPFRKSKVIDCDDIHAVGRVSFSGNNSRFFICTSCTNEIITFFNQNPDYAKRMFGPERVKLHLENADGMWKMALSVYIYFSKSKKVFFIYHHSDAVLMRIATILGQKEINVGPMLME